MQILLIRHGVTALTEAGRYQGRLDTPLSPTGRAALQKADFTPREVLVSPLLRAVETAELLFPNANLRPLPGVKEMDFGAFEGRNWREMEQDPDYRAWVDSGCTLPCPGGEDRAAFTERCCAAFASAVEEARAAGQQELVLVAHGGTQMAVLERWGRPRRDYYAWCARPGTGYRLDDRLWPEALELIDEVSFLR